MTAGNAPFTIEELYLLPSGYARYELIHGVLVEGPLSGARHGLVLTAVLLQMMTYVEPRRLGEVLIGSTGIILDRNPDHVRAPDACFISVAQLADDSVSDGYLEFVPELIIEIPGPEDVAAAVEQKTEEWLQAGARVVWTLDPETHTIAVSDLATGTRVLHEDEMLNGEPVLPGFSVSVGAFFD